MQNYLISILIPHSFNILALQSLSDRLDVETNPESMFAITSLEDLGAATCKVLRKSFGSPSEVLQNTFRIPLESFRRPLESFRSPVQL